MVSVLYAEGSFFCAIILFLIYMRTNSVKEFSQSSYIFKVLLVCSCVFCLIDGSWGLVASQVFGKHLELYRIFTYAFHICASLISLVWYQFSIRYLGQKIYEKFPLRILPFFLLAFELSIIISNIWTGQMFEITADYEYITYPMRLVLFVSQFLNYAIIFVIAFIYYLNDKKKDHKFYTQSTMVYTLISIVTGLGQFILPDSPVYSIGFTTSGFIIFAYIIIHENKVLMLEYQDKKNQEEYQNKLKQDFSVLSSISGYYEVLAILDITDENMKILNASDRIREKLPHDNSVMDGKDFDKCLKQILTQEDINTLVQNLGRENAVDKLMQLQRMTFDMPASFDNWQTECKIRIYLAINRENNNHVAFGIRDITTEYHMEKQIEDQQRIITNLEMQNEMSKMMASIDGLTGLTNKVSFIDEVERYIAANSSENCALIFFDMDHFKNINDIFGHEKGDEALREMAKKLRSLFRSDEMIARMGGDEFCIFLPLISKHIVEDRINQMNKTLVAEYSDKNNKIKTSASIGCAYSESADKTYVEMHAVADKAMYEVKRKGRNGNVIKVI